MPRHLNICVTYCSTYSFYESNEGRNISVCRSLQKCWCHKKNKKDGDKK